MVAAGRAQGLELPVQGLHYNFRQGPGDLVSWFTIGLLKL